MYLNDKCFALKMMHVAKYVNNGDNNIVIIYINLKTTIDKLNINISISNIRNYTYTRCSLDTMFLFFFIEINLDKTLLE